MKTLTEIEAVLPRLSCEELARVRDLLQRLLPESAADPRFDGRPWPASSQSIADELAEIDALPPLLSAEEADRLDGWIRAERERQKSLAQPRGMHVSKLFD